MYEIKTFTPKLRNFFPKSYKKNFNFKDIHEDQEDEQAAAKYNKTLTQQQIPTWAPSQAIPMRFTEKHLIESLNVGAIESKKPVMFYSMLNQGNKRGK
jgi:hypothetical protein